MRIKQYVVTISFTIEAEGVGQAFERAFMIVSRENINDGEDNFVSVVSVENCEEL
jgi:hypothetical protein